MAEPDRDFPDLPDGLIRRYVAAGLALERLQLDLTLLGYPVDGPPEAVCAAILRLARPGTLPALTSPATPEET